MGKRHDRRAAAAAKATARTAPGSQMATRPVLPGGMGARSLMPGGMGFGGVGGGGVAGIGGDFQLPYQAASLGPGMPRVSDYGPRALVTYQPTLRRLVRHYHRNSTLVGRAVRAMGQSVVGNGPVAIGEFEALNRLWADWWDQSVDSTGAYGGGDFLRESIFKPTMVDGEVFARIRFDPRRSDPMGRDYRSVGAVVPLSIDVMQAEQFPVAYNMPIAGGGGVACAIEFAADGRTRTGYWGYEGYPGDYLANTRSAMLTRYAAREILHVFEAPCPNSPRGEVSMAPGVLTVIRLDQFMEADFRRIDVAARFAGFIKETVQQQNESQFAQNNMYDDMMGLLALESGSMFRLPPGFEVTFSDPPQFAAGSVESMKFQQSLFAACIGIPLYELDMTYAGDLSDRVMKVAALSFQQLVDTKRSQLRRQFLAPTWRYFVDAVVAMGLWSPPNAEALVRAYRDEWRWPLIKSTQMTQELPVLIQARDAGFISTDAVSQGYFGVRANDVARDEAGYQATMRSLGFSPSPTPTPVDAAPAPKALPAPDGDKPKKDAPKDAGAVAEAPAPAAPPAPSGKAPVPTWDPNNSALAAAMLSDAEAEEMAAYKSRG